MNHDKKEFSIDVLNNLKYLGFEVENIKQKNGLQYIVNIEGRLCELTEERISLEIIRKQSHEKTGWNMDLYIPFI